jgi:hypothetical protein
MAGAAGFCGGVTFWAGRAPGASRRRSARARVCMVMGEES